MAGIRKEPGPAAQRVAANIRHVRREAEVTTAALSERLAKLGHPIADTGITKTEKGDRGIYVDDLVALALALGVTPNTLLLPQVEYIDARDTHPLTPAVSGTPEELWEWAQGESPLDLPVPDLPSPSGADRVREFVLRSRSYLTAIRAPGASANTPAQVRRVRELSAAVQRATRSGATAAEIRRVVELTMTHPPMTEDEIAVWLDDSPRPGEDS